MSGKVKVGVLYGGRSAEHDVSVLSARNVFAAIDRDRFDVLPIAVTRSGRWLLVDPAKAGETITEDGDPVALLPGGKGQLMVASSKASPAPIDVLFPVLHGPFGEDGSVQGYAEVADVAYVGCGVFGSAAAMDKGMAKRLLSVAGIPVARSRRIERGDSVTFGELVSELGSPVFLKPASQGSSFGVSKAGGNGSSFPQALENAFRYDDVVLAEEFMDAREIECAVLENPDGSLTVSDPGEIVTAKHHDFYSYEAKYIDADGALVKAPADVPAETAARSREMAAAAFKALGCSGMARVDFFLKADGSLLINEVNTIPGFTNISMYAKALASNGIAYRDVISILIDTALARYARRARFADAA